jgi:hypothetical protein
VLLARLAVGRRKAFDSRFRGGANVGLAPGVHRILVEQIKRAFRGGERQLLVAGGKVHVAQLSSALGESGYIPALSFIRSIAPGKSFNGFKDLEIVLLRHEIAILLLAFLIGVIAGLCSLTAPGVVAWAARQNWLNLHNLPSTPSRLKPPGLTPRIVLGGLSGAAVAASASRSIALVASCARAVPSLAHLRVTRFAGVSCALSRCRTSSSRALEMRWR